MQTSVITLSQARQITGGRKPLVPVEYEAACNALAQCLDLDEAKYWSDKSDALAAWAKIYHDDQVSIEARRLKLKAYRRMGALAAELRPNKLGIQRGAKGRTGSAPGPISLLMEKGLSKNKASSARRLALMDKSRFDQVVNSPRPPSPTVSPRYGSDAWHKLTATAKASTLLSFCRHNDPKEFARRITPDEIDKSRNLVRELMEWLDTFEQYLPS